jgi:hypothetical protein
MISRLANNGLITEQQLGRMIQLRPGSTLDDALRAFSTSIQEWEPILDRLVDLFLRMRTTKQAEIAATVHFVAAELRRQNQIRPHERAVLDAVMQWKLRRQPPLDRAEVARTIRDLAVLGWLEVDSSNDLPLSDEDALIA